MYISNASGSWGEGEKFKVRLPRNNFTASKLYTGTAPLFATMADLFSYPLDKSKKTGRNTARENNQFAERWSVVRFRPLHVVSRRAVKPVGEHALC